MAFDPIQEDCLRLTIGAMRRDHVPPDIDASYLDRCMDRYREDPANLIATDADRSFHLVVLATESLDYRVPFLPDAAQADREEAAAVDMLAEAVALDPSNWDAQRMLFIMRKPSNSAYVEYLVDHEDEVRADLERRRREGGDDYAADEAEFLAWRPLARWLAALSARSLITGQYRLSLDAARRCLELDPTDQAGARRTAALSLAKLEADVDEIERFRLAHEPAARQHPEPGRRARSGAVYLDPWFSIARLTSAYRSFDLDGATREIESLIAACPHAAEPLALQTEFPEGIFCRVNVEEGSEDELILALSEATPLLQEGLGQTDELPYEAPLSSWIAWHPAGRAARGARARASAARTSPGEAN